MLKVLATSRRFLIATLVILLAGFLSGAASAQKKPKIIKEKKTKPAASQEKKSKPSKQTKPMAESTPSTEPDKILYERAMNDIQHHKFIDGRLALQTLINTYPDSEYLAKAKLGMADSFYKEGGTSNLTQAVEEYKNFIVFFPFLDEAAYAQMQVGMAHYQMMEKSDRDNNQAGSAEAELQTFLLKYPQSPLVPDAEQKLRDVQEILADGEFRIGRYYYMKQDYRASAARLMEVSERYPLYSQSDESLALLGEIYERARQASRNEDDKNHWAGLAAECYERIVRDYPLSDRTGDAKSRLKDMGRAVPEADPQALARMRKQQEYEKHHHRLVFLRFPLGMIRSRPDLYVAARSGAPNLNPPDDLVSATEVLKPGAVGPSFDVIAQKPAPASDPNSGDDSAPVELQPADAPGDAPATTAAAQIIEAPTSSATSAASSPSTSPAASSSTADSATANASIGATAESQAAAGSTANSQSSAQQATGKGDSKNESSSKKKKGLKKLVPW